jgi:DNA polymerase III delta prime subunit
LDFFLKNKKWYDEKGIPYTIGLLLSGQAGAGKTSTVKCLANETNRHIININLNNDITKTQFENLFFNEVISVLNTSTGQTEKYSIPLDQRIYVLEDIDCQSDLVMERYLKGEIDTKEESDLTLLQSVKTNPNNYAEFQNQVLVDSFFAF